MFMKNRLGPDVWGHFRLYFKSWMQRICKKQFDFFGEGSELRPMAYVAYPSNISIGRGVAIRPGCRLYADPDTYIIVGDNVLLAPGVHVYTNNHAFGRKDIPICEQGYGVQENVILEDGCWIGANAIILPGVIVGQNAVVGAGSVVTKDVPAFTVVVGNPAKAVLYKRKLNVVSEPQKL